jgi:hypothetical protein
VRRIDSKNQHGAIFRNSQIVMRELYVEKLENEANGLGPYRNC